MKLTLSNPNNSSWFSKGKKFKFCANVLAKLGVTETESEYTLEVVTKAKKGFTKISLIPQIHYWTTWEWQIEGIEEYLNVFLHGIDDYLNKKFPKNKGKTETLYFKFTKK